MKIERTGKDVLTVRMERKAGLCGEFLLISDIHWDSVHCDRRMLKRTLDEALQRGAGILIGGDLFDAMCGVGDRRGGKGELREELAGSNYLDLLVDGAVEWFYPYRENIVMVGKGNHDTSIIKYHETDLVARFCRDLGVQRMGYSCMVEFFFERPTGGNRKSFEMFYHHGFGGGGKVTKGVNQHQGRSAENNADIFWSGHHHNVTNVESMKRYLAKVGEKREIRERPEVHLATGSFKNSPDMEGGWETEKGMGAKPKGGYWLRFEERYGTLGFLTERTWAW